MGMGIWPSGEKPGGVQRSTEKAGATEGIQSVEETKPHGNEFGIIFYGILLEKQV